MTLLPPFTDDGVLPVGDYTLTLGQLLASQLVRGPRNKAQWDGKWRRTLVKNLMLMVDHLQQVDISDIYIDGSFVGNKPHPNDIDGYFICDRDFFYDGDLEAGLQKIDPVWTWDADRRSASAESGKQKGIVKIGGLS